MKNIKRTIAGVSALTFAFGLTACGGGSEGGSTADTTAATAATTTAATVEINTEARSDEENEAINATASILRDVELENKTVKWLCHWDLNPDTTGKKLPVPLQMFQDTYGAKIEWYPTTWETRFSDLSKYVLGGEGVDFFQRDSECLPKGVVNGMFQPVDEYLDLNDDLWKDVNAAMEQFNFNGKHYALATGVSANNVVIYNKKTIEEYGFEDPWDLYEAGKWNWNTFTDMLQEFCDASEDNYGLDGWWTELALYRSAGVPAIAAQDGKLTVNLGSPAIEKAENMMLDLYNKGCILPKEQFDWAEQPQFMGEGRELFYIIGPWNIMSAPETWSTGIAPEDVAIAPVPNAPDAEHPWQDAVIDGFCICKGAANPLGAVLYAECERAAALGTEAAELYDQDCREVFMWSEDVIERRKIINDLARQYPVVDIAAGISADVASLTTDGGEQVGLRAPMHGYDWATAKEEISDVVDMLVAEADEAIKNAQ